MRLTPLLFLGLAIGLLVPALSAADSIAPDDDLPVVVPIGAGSYAARPPRSQAGRPGVAGKSGSGDLSQVLTHQPLNLTPGEHGAIPSTDWWTNLLTKEWGGELWAYPLMLRPDRQGLVVTCPRTWEMRGKEAKLVPEHRLLLRGAGFRPTPPQVESWSDWLVTWRLTATPDSWMRITIGHGLPTTWIETAGVEPRIDLPDATLFNDAGATAALPLTGDHLGLEAGNDRFGVFAPAGTVFCKDGDSLAVRFSGTQRWLAISALTKRADLARFATYAAAVPRDSRVDWRYQPELGRVATTWTLKTDNLAGGSNHDVIQGWIPHHYQTDGGSQLDFTTTDLTYPTPRGELRCAVGQHFGISWPFTGLVPELPAPVVSSAANPFRPEVMRSLVEKYTGVTGYGFETYWGGKKILLYGKYLEMADQLGMTDAAAVFARRLREALTDWATYTPGEHEHFFAMYPNWGSLVGFRTRDNANPGIDVLQDHAFCYGYHVYAAALLARRDPQFAADYGPLFRLVVKDYANWERDDKRFPFFRSLDPWCGHSWSGGLGSDTGNGMESSSESVQAWGAMFVFAEAIGDTAMRDAAAFGYAMESRGVAEYWFDRWHRNLPRPLWPYAHNGNTTTDGIGWWTWFSGDPFWMHAIQWLPMSPLLRYLGEDPAFAKADYTAMWADKKIGGWDSNLGKESGVGNVALSYFTQFDPDQAAQVFDQLWDGNMPTAHAVEEAGPTYWRIHAGRALGRIAADAWTDVPTTMVWRDPTTRRLTVAAWNPGDTDRPCRVFDQGKQVASIVLPAHRIIAHHLDAAAATLNIDAPASTITPGAPLALTGTVHDQYGAAFPAAVTWKVAAGAQVSATGAFTAANAGNYVVEATSGALHANRSIRVGAAPVATHVAIAPATPRVVLGETLTLSATVTDQYNDPSTTAVRWTLNGGATIDARGRVSATTPGIWTVTATAGAASVSVPLLVRIPPSDVARGKPTTASTQSANDRAGAMATDGDEETRWQSKPSDGEWLAVDLGALHQLDHASLRWEAAYGKDYDLQGSADGSAWQTISEVRGGNGGEEEVALHGTARWVRLLGRARGTNWGYSLYRFAVYGTPVAAAGGGIPVALTVSPATVLMSDRGTQRFTATAYDAQGKVVAITPTWRVEGSGVIDASGLYTPHGGNDFAHSAFSIIAEANGLRAAATAAVEESRKIAALNVKPDPGAGNALTLALGAGCRLSVEATDQFRAHLELPVTWSASGGVKVDAQGRITATALGTGTVTATASLPGAPAVTSTIACTVVKAENMNLAAGKPVSASSGNGGSAPEMAVDGDPKTRWESAHSDPQWLVIDLEATYTLRSVTLRWEAARAKVYRIEVSNDRVMWQPAFTTSDGKGKVDTCDLKGAVGRYVRLTCEKRSGGYGNSLWEFEVYGSAK